MNAIDLEMCLNRYLYSLHRISNGYPKRRIKLSDSYGISHPEPLIRKTQKISNTISQIINEKTLTILSEILLYKINI
jgi:hypothetical protein